MNGDPLDELDEQGAEITRLRSVIDRAAAHWVHLHPGVAWEGDLADAMAAAVAEIARLRLTDAEREALCWVCGDVADITGPVEETIRGLLERLA